MAINRQAYQQIKAELDHSNTVLVAISKTKPVADILELYEMGHRDFGENYVQELVDKQSKLPRDIRWHFVGHLQRNKVRQIASFVQLIQSVDSLKLLEEINKEGAKNQNTIHCLLQVHIAEEETKFGLDEKELEELLMKLMPAEGFGHVKISGLMGMASFTDNQDTIRKEFKHLQRMFDRMKAMDKTFTTLSMGMSQDYKVALEEGSNMVRIGSLIFGERAAEATETPS